MTISRALCVLFLGLCAPIALAAFDPQVMRQKHIVGATYHLMGYTGVQTRDVDDMLGDEVLIGYLSMWHLLKWDTSKETFTQIGFYENGVGNIFGGGGLQSVQFAALEPSKGVEVAALTANGQIGLFSLEGSLRTVWTPGLREIVRMRVVNLDETAGDEVLLQTCKDLTAWRFGSPAPIWRIPVDECSAVQIAQLDTDPQLEIALGAGRVFDTRTMAQEWRYPLGFGATLTTADITRDGIPDLIGCRGRQCDAFDVTHRTTLWETFLPYASDMAVLAAADVDFDGTPDVFGGDSQHGAIRRMSSVTGEVLAQFEKSGGTNFIAIGNLDGDCDLELIWGKDGDSTALDSFYVTDPVTMKTFWSSVPEERGSSGLLFGDFSGTGDPSLLWANQAGSVLRFVSFDPASHTVRRTADRSDWYAERFPIVTAAQLDTDPAIEYVLPLTENSIATGPIAVHDGATHQLEWTMIPTGDTITSMDAGDLTGDGVADIVLGSSILYFPASHPDKVVAIDGATRRILWETKDRLSSVLDAGCSGCIVQVAIRDLNLDGRKEVLAIVPSNGLFAFDGSNGAPLWHRETLTQAWAFTVADIDASPGLEIIVPFYGTGKIAVFDSTGATRLRDKDIQQFGAGLAVQVADLDSDGSTELVVVADEALLVLSSATLDILWSGGSVLPWFSLGNQMVIADVDGDSTTEIVVPSAHSLHVFEYRPNTPDTTAPVFRSHEIRTSALLGCCGIALEWAPAFDGESMPVTYRVHRSVVQQFVPDSSTFLDETSLPSYVDRSLPHEQLYFYVATAVDRAGNETALSARGSAMAPRNCKAGKQRSVRRH